MKPLTKGQRVTLRRVLDTPQAERTPMQELLRAAHYARAYLEEARETAAELWDVVEAAEDVLREAP